MSGQVSLSNVTKALDKLTDEERAALRASRFHSQPAPEPAGGRRRLAHPGGPLATNKAAALAKFLKRKLESDGPATLDPDLVERAVENAKASSRYGLSVGLESVRHVDSFSDTEKSEDVDDELKDNSKVSKVRQGVTADGSKREKKKKKKKLKKELKAVEAASSRPKQSRKKERKGLANQTSKKNLKASRNSLKVKDKKISKKDKKRPPPRS